MNATPDNTSADPEQLIADLQRQLAECKAERDEALQRETAVAEVLQVINSSPGDLTPVFEAMLEKAMRLCEAETAHLARYENGVFSRTASRGVREDFDKILPLNTPVPHIITRDSIPYRMVATRAAVHVLDSREDESARRRTGSDRRGGERDPHYFVRAAVEGR
jgi:two-component system, NtrC family, sensor kinase